ncbi:glycosyltransferase family 2 protein [Flavobacterium sp. M31R6]|uniref:glycosyltransferase family 2 protein n=1 Tax=Flavobacterium sp. M31R6 TaxID=2739062 RepID=UPI0015689DC5|nr:glycosyltransferase family 2 protein [Flavobacterium sp. M31R6]QKJ64403.1 glycosyltransferase family 2 protein [Flavobacterium sp. M31R6]
MTTQEKHDVAVILINYNSSEHSINCIHSILKNTSDRLNFQIIITDNASEEKDYLNLKKFCDQENNPNIKLYRSNINTGFGGGNMHGVQFANANYLAFLNNDTLLLNDCLSILKKFLEENKNTGIVGGQAYKEDGTFMLCSDHFASPYTEIFGKKILEKLNPKKYPKSKRLYDNPTRVNYITGSFMFMRTEDFNEIGGFDTNIFLYHEESDLCKRLLNISKLAYLIPDAKFIHLHGVSTTQSIAIKKELKISLLYVIQKHYGFWAHKIVLVFLTIKYFFSGIIKSKNRALFMLVLNGAPLTKSLKQIQKIKQVN